MHINHPESDLSGEDEFGLYWYHYGWRFLDPVLFFYIFGVTPSFDVEITAEWILIQRMNFHSIPVGGREINSDRYYHLTSPNYTIFRGAH